jgi:Rho termination factor, N-terminal domain.
MQKLTRKFISSLRVKDLRQIAKELKIKDYWLVRKKVLIDKIMCEYYRKISKEERPIASVKTEEFMFHPLVEKYVIECPLGDEIAFVDEQRIVKTGYVKRKFIEDKKLHVLTFKKEIFIINFEQVLWWRKPDTRYPFPIYQKIKEGRGICH